MTITERAIIMEAIVVTVGFVVLGFILGVGI